MRGFPFCHVALQNFRPASVRNERDHSILRTKIAVSFTANVLVFELLVDAVKIRDLDVALRKVFLTRITRIFKSKAHLPRCERKLSDGAFVPQR